MPSLSLPITALAVLASALTHGAVAGSVLVLCTSDGYPRNTEDGVVVTAALKGPRCYTKGLTVTLPADAGNVRVEDVWVEGAGITITAIPSDGSLTLQDVRVAPTVVADSHVVGVLYQPRAAATAGRLVLANAEVSLQGSHVATSTAVRGIGVSIDNKANRLLHIQLTGGSVAVNSETTKISHGAGVAISGNVNLMATPPSGGATNAGPRIDFHVSGPGSDADALVAAFHAPETDAVAFQFLALHGVKANVSSETDATVVGVLSHGATSPVHLNNTLVTARAKQRSFAVKASYATLVRTKLTAVGYRGTGVFVNGGRIFHSAVTAAMRKPSPAVRFVSALKLPLTVQGTNLTATAQAPHAPSVKEDDVPSVPALPAAVQVDVPSGTARLRLVDVRVALSNVTESCLVGSVGNASQAVQVFMSGVRCAEAAIDGGVPVGQLPAADPAAVRAAMGPNVTEWEHDGCEAGFLLDVDITPADLPGLGNKCLLSLGGDIKRLSDVGLRLTGVAPGASVTVGGANLSYLVLDSVPKGASVSVDGCRIGPQPPAPPAYRPVLRVYGSVEGQLRVTGGSVLRGPLSVTGDLVSPGGVTIDGAVVELAGVVVQGSSYQPVRIGETQPTTFSFGNSTHLGKGAHLRGGEKFDDGGESPTSSAASRVGIWSATAGFFAVSLVTSMM